jgi:hypothetical protein
MKIFVIPEVSRRNCEMQKHNAVPFRFFRFCSSATPWTNSPFVVCP